MKPKQYSGSEPGGDIQSSRLDSPQKRWQVIADKVLAKRKSLGRQRNDLVSRDLHPCVKNSSPIVIGAKLITVAQCYDHSMLGCSGKAPVYHKCVPTYKYDIDLDRIFTTGCNCAS